MVGGGLQAAKRFSSQLFVPRHLTEHLFNVQQQPSLLSVCWLALSQLLTSINCMLCYNDRVAQGAAVPASVLAVCLLSLEESACRCKEGAVLLPTLLAALLLSTAAALVGCRLSRVDGPPCVVLQVRCCLGGCLLCRRCLDLVPYTSCMQVLPVLFDAAASGSSQVPFRCVKRSGAWPGVALKTTAGLAASSHSLPHLLRLLQLGNQPARKLRLWSWQTPEARQSLPPALLP